MDVGLHALDKLSAGFAVHGGKELLDGKEASFHWRGWGRKDSTRDWSVKLGVLGHVGKVVAVKVRGRKKGDSGDS